MLLPLGSIGAQPTGLPALAGLGGQLPRRNTTVATAKLNKVGQTLTTVTFPAGTTVWTAPNTTHWIEGLAQGGTGSNGSSGYYYYYDYVTSTNYAANGNIINSSGTWDYSGTGIAPADHCDTTYPNGTDTSNPSYVRNVTCHDTTQYHDSGTPATYGGSTTAFDMVIPGVLGTSQVPAVPITPYAVQPGQTFTIFVASGGSVTISYYQ